MEDLFEPLIDEPVPTMTMMGEWAAAGEDGDNGVEQYHRRLVYGSLAFWLGPGKQQQSKTHNWTLYVRGPHNEDLSHFVRNVEFHLHESFEPPVRVISQPPFQVTESGWGEFEVKIVVNFLDPGEDPVVFLHVLRLHPLDGGPPNTRNPVVSEVQEDIIFENPSRLLKDALNAHPQDPDRLLEPHPMCQSGEDKVDEAENRQLADAIARVKKQTRACVEQLNSACAVSLTLRQEINHVILTHGRVAKDDEITLWRPEDYRHVPMAVEQDTTKKKASQPRKKAKK